jgi:hypothetical protein
MRQPIKRQHDPAVLLSSSAGLETQPPGSEQLGSTAMDACVAWLEAIGKRRSDFTIGSFTVAVNGPRQCPTAVSFSIPF